jgi:hypothetical protein
MSEERRSHESGDGDGVSAQSVFRVHVHASLLPPTQTWQVCMVCMVQMKEQSGMHDTHSTTSLSGSTQLNECLLALRSKMYPLAPSEDDTAIGWVHLLAHCLSFLTAYKMLAFVSTHKQHSV